MIDKVIENITLTDQCRILEVGSNMLSESDFTSKSFNVTLDSLNFNKEFTLTADYDIIIVPELFNHLTKEEAFFLLDILLKFTKEAVYLVINEYESKEPLFITDFSHYDSSYYHLEAINRHLIKVHKQHVMEKVDPCILNHEIAYRSLKILYILPHQNLTGGLKMLFEQMKSLQKRGHYIKVLIRGDFSAVVPDWVEAFNPDEEIVIKAFDSYTDHFKDVDLVFAGFYNQINELENDQVPVLYWEQGHEYLYGDVKDKNLEPIIRHSLTQEFKRNIYLATDSQYVHDIVKCRFNRESFILPIFIDTNFYYPLATKADNELLTVLLVGNPALTFKGFSKALTVLLNAWNQGCRFRVEWACQIKPTLSALPFEIVYHENVSQSVLATVYRHADILLTCSLYEGCPMPPLEAMASGVAVVTTNSGGINQYATHEENALIAFSNTITELTQLLIIALTDSEKRKSLIKKGHETAISLNFENGSLLLEKILLSVVADYQLQPTDSRKKVLFMIGTLMGGGAEKVLCDWVKLLDPDLFNITVQTVFDQGIYIDEIKQYAKYKTLFKMTAYSEEELRQLQEYHQYLQSLPDEKLSQKTINEHYDIEIAFLEDQSTKIIAYSPNTASRKIAWIHTNLINEPGSIQFYRDEEQQKDCYKKFDDIVFVSQGAKDAFIEKFNIETNFHVIANPIDEQAIIKKAQEPLETTLINEKFKIISVGRLVPIKGLDRLLIVHHKLIQDGFDYELWLLGEGPQRALIEQFILENHLEDSVKLLGFKQNPYPYIAGANLTVCASHAEGFSLAVAESLVLGTPVLTTRCEGPVELLANGKYGVVVENDLQALYEGMHYLLTHTTEYYKYCQRVKSWKPKQSIKELKNLLLSKGAENENL